MISAWARICKILGEEFAAFLPLVMPPVLRAASIKPDVTLMNDEDIANQEEDPDWNFVPLGDQKMFGKLVFFGVFFFSFYYRKATVFDCVKSWIFFSF